MRRNIAVTPSRHGQRGDAIRSHGAASGWLRCARKDGFGVICAALLISAPALAAPKSIADCEAIQEADAYNRCLASFGPVRGQRGAAYPGVATEGGKGAGKRGAAVRRSGGFSTGAQVTRGRGGRVRMEFTPGRR